MATRITVNPIKTINVRVNQKQPIVNRAATTFVGGVDSSTLAKAAFDRANTAYDIANTTTATITTNNYNALSNTQVAVDSFLTTTYRSVKYEVQISWNSEYHLTEIRLVHDDTEAYMTQYGEMYTIDSLGEFDADVQSGNLRLLFTPINNNTSIKLIRTTIPV